MIDTHCHPYVDAYADDRREMLRRAKNAGVQRILCPGIDSESHETMLALCRENPDLCIPMMGLHPTVVNDNPLWESELEIVERYLDGGGFCAVGEVGLDLHWSRDSLANQIIAFERQIELALRHNLPLAIHTRDAWPEMLEVLSRFASRGLRGVLHAFSGTVDDYLRARQFGDFALGLGGAVTYRKNLWINVLPHIDLDHLVLETDAPWLPPTPHRGLRNEPAYLIYILEAAAKILEIPPAELDRRTTENAIRIFGL